MLKLIPAPLQRILMPFAHWVRHRWRQWRRAQLFGVSVVIVNARQQVLLVRHSYGPESWMLPGGGVQRGEEPALAARREVWEELGVEFVQLDKLGALDEVISGSPHRAYVFAARADGPVTPDQREVLEARYFSLAQLPQGISALTRRRLALWEARSQQ